MFQVQLSFVMNLSNVAWYSLLLLLLLLLLLVDKHRVALLGT